MLKLTTKERSGSLIVVLEGRLCHPWTNEVERGWSKLISSGGNKELTLDLDGVTFVDRDGEALLASMLEHGTKVRASGVLIRHLVEQARKKIARRDPQNSRGAPDSHREPGAP